MSTPAGGPAAKVTWRVSGKLLAALTTTGLAAVTALQCASLIYVPLVAVHTFFQRKFATASKKMVSRRGRPGTRWPSVDVIVPCYREDPQVLRACCEALARQVYDGELHVYVVDDGSPNLDELMPIYRQFAERAGWHVFLSEPNAGKRKAQDTAVRKSNGEIVVLIDSDTKVEPDGIRKIVAAFSDPGMASAVGRLLVANEASNWLTRLVSKRYEVLFNQERAAQGYHDSVLCCCGAFSAYRRSALQGVWPAYMAQTFWGVACTDGEDIQLTTLLLRQGWRSTYVPEAVARTYVPSRLGAYFQQQVRWHRGFYRELLWAIPLLPSRSRYLALDITARALPPFLLLSGILALPLAPLLPPERARYGLLGVVAMALTQAVLSFWQARSARYLLAYGLLHVLLLIPARLVALLTIRTNRWGTRGSPRPAVTATAVALARTSGPASPPPGSLSPHSTGVPSVEPPLLPGPC